MILDSLQNAALYHGLSPGLAAGLKWLRETDISTLAVGKHPIPGTECTATVLEYPTKPIEEGRLEAHRRFIDIQYLISGNERIGYAATEGLVPATDYDDPADIIFLRGEGAMFILRAGDFAVFWPHDAHMPAVAVDAPSFVRKIVIKVPV